MDDLDPGLIREEEEVLDVYPGVLLALVVFLSIIRVKEFGGSEEDLEISTRNELVGRLHFIFVTSACSDMALKHAHELLLV